MDEDDDGLCDGRQKDEEQACDHRNESNDERGIIRRDCFVSPSSSATTSAGIRVSPMYTHVRKKSIILSAPDDGFGNGCSGGVNGIASQADASDYRLLLQLR